MVAKAVSPPGGGKGANEGGLSEAQVDARVVAVAGDALHARSISTGSIADDSVFEFDPAANGLSTTGQFTLSGNIAGNRGIFEYRVGSSAFCNAIAATGITATTGALEGTTGSDSTVTVSTHTDGKIYIENRMAAPRTFRVAIFSHP